MVFLLENNKEQRAIEIYDVLIRNMFLLKYYYVSYNKKNNNLI